MNSETYVMSCNKMMVLCGETYSSRLWCIWELFTLLAFTDLKVALQRFHLVPLASNTISCEQLAVFQLDNAHCYDPNEEAKLRLTIDSLGNDVFGQRVRTLGQALTNKGKTTTLKR